jgi:hypothetical protein
LRVNHVTDELVLPGMRKVADAGHREIEADAVGTCFKNAY